LMRGGYREGRRSITALCVAVAILGSSCAPPPAGRDGLEGGASGAGTGGAEGPPGKTLVMSIEREPNYISPLAPIAGLAATDFYQRMFSAFLDYYDDQN